LGEAFGIASRDAEIEAWARSVVGDAASVSLVDPSAFGATRAASSPTVEISLVEVRPRPGADMPGRPTLRLALRYLVTVRADDVRSGHAVLSKLAFAAMAREGQDVERDVDWLAFWRAMGAPPRPAFLLGAEVEEIRPTPPRAKVPARGLRVVEFVLPAPGSTFRGLVVRHGGGPVVGATILCEAAGAKSVTDAEGHFDLGALPPWPPRKRLEVRLGGESFQFEVDVSHADGQSQARPLTLEIGVS